MSAGADTVNSFDHSSSPSADNCVTYSIDIGNTLLMSHNGSQSHHFKVNYHLDSVPVVVGVTFQIHTQSRDGPYETTTNGTHVGLVQFRSSEQNQTEFYATFKRGPTNGTVRALIAAVPIYMNGECSGSIWGVGGAGEGRGEMVGGM